MPLLRTPLLALTALALAPAAARAQHHPAPADTAARAHAMVGAQAVGLVTHAAPAFDGRAFTEGYLTQPAVMAHASVPQLLGLRLVTTLNFEGLTLDRGELNAGIYGEGYVDRRHPHTLVHEAMASVGGARWSVAAGKGFVPFGSDDPMMRPFVKFPINHHLAQVLERWVAIAGVRAGPALLEVAAFNGDEPVGAYAWPSAGRFGDSWAARLTVAPTPWLELSASGATVASPEHVDGEGVDQTKVHVGARVAHEGPTWRYALVEYARTDDVNAIRRAHYYESLLAEAAAGVGRWEVALRGERTNRPEEERLVDPFRAPRPHGDGNVLGITRWDVVTAGVGRVVPAGALTLRPFVEVATSRVVDRFSRSAFEPVGFYGDDRLWSSSVGLRVGWGMRHARMGRYGVAAVAPAGHAPPPAVPGAAAGHDPAAHGTSTP